MSVEEIERYNVLADEIRKLDERVDRGIGKTEVAHAETLHEMRQSIEVLRAATSTGMPEVRDALERIEAWQRGLTEELEGNRKRLGQLDNRLYMIEKTEFTTLRQMIRNLESKPRKKAKRGR